MKRIGDEVHLHADEARAGETPHILRYILAISLFMTIATLSAVWITAALSQQQGGGRPVTAEEHALGLSR